MAPRLFASLLIS